MGHPSTGPIVVSLYKMLVQDVLVFFSIYIVFLLGFTQAFFVQFGDYGHRSFMHRIKACFMTMLGDIDMETYYDPEKVSHPTFSVSLVTLYIVLTAVMLINLLV